MRLDTTIKEHPERFVPEFLWWSLVYFHIKQAVENALITLPLPPKAIAFRRMMFKTIDDVDDLARDFVRDKIVTYTLEETLPEKADDIDTAFIDHC